MTDDVEFQRWLKETREHFEKLNRLTSAVLCAHHLAEGCLNDFIVANGIGHRCLKRATFDDKMLECRALAAQEKDHALWGVLKSANRLRNTIVHDRYSAKVERRIKELRSICQKVLSPKRAEEIAEHDDAYAAMLSFALCSDFIMRLQVRFDRRI